MHQLRRRLFLAFFAAMLLALALPILYGRQKMHNDVLEDMRVATLREAHLTAALLEARPDIATNGLQAFLSEQSSKIGARFTFVSENGDVLADSNVHAESVDELPRHTDRPEITSAMHNGYGSAIRHSATLKMDQIYAAVAVIAGTERPAGVIRVAIPFAGIAGRVDSLAFGLGAGALLVALLSYFLSHFMLRRLETAIKDMTYVVECTAPKNFSGVTHTSLRPSLPPRREFRELSLAVSDMTDRVEYQICTIEAQKAELASILDTMTEGVLVLDQRGRIRRGNPALSHLFPAMTHAEGKLPVEVIPLAPLQQAIDTLLTDSTPRVLSLTLDYGREQTIAVQLTRLDSHQDVGAVVVLHDVSEMAKIVRMKRDLIANVSHELRTPLTAIQGYADTLADPQVAMDEDPQTRLKFINIIRKHAGNMMRLVDDLLTLSRLENRDEHYSQGHGKDTICSPDTLPLALQDALDDCRPMADSHGVTIHTMLPQGVCVRMDASRLSQVFRNLVENACKYAPDNTPIFILGEVVEQGEELRVSVQDFGPGVPESELERIFDRFHRVEKHRGGGTGLGLAICKHIVERMGGRIWAEYAAAPLNLGIVSPDSLAGNTMGKPVGATFRFTLPLAPATSEN